MNIHDVRRLFEYTEWANARIFSVIDDLTEEQFARTIESSFPSIRATLAHVISAEWIWMRRWTGESPASAPDWASGAPREELHRRLDAVQAERTQLLEALNDDGLAEIVSYRSIRGDAFAYPLGEQMLHVANHSTYHRGQLTTMLRQVGATPPATDWLVFQRSLK
jgi:uncharacterized damage-inducible protein DinB